MGAGDEPLSRQRGELSELEEDLLGIERPTPEQEEDAQREIEQQEELRKAFLVHLMSNEMFRKWLFTQLQAFGTFDNAFGATPTGFPDPYATWFKAGMKAAGWSLWEVFDEAAPDLASLMRREGLKG